MGADAAAGDDHDTAPREGEAVAAAAAAVPMGAGENEKDEPGGQARHAGGGSEAAGSADEEDGTLICSIIPPTGKRTMIVFWQAKQQSDNE